MKFKKKLKDVVVEYDDKTTALHPSGERPKFLLTWTVESGRLV